jgi:carboxypeptidase Q
MCEDSAIIHGLHFKEKIMRRIVTLLSAMFLLACPLFAANDAAPEPASPATDGTLPALTAIAGEGMVGSHAYDYLQELSDDIGGRVTGSPACARAVEWGVEKMKSIGLANVHTEKWQLSRGWTRVSADAELVSPVERRLKVDSMGWVGSTPAGGAEGDVVTVNDYDLENEINQNASHWEGKILLVVQKGEPPKDRMSSFAKFGDFLRAAYTAHAVAVIGGQGGSKAAGMRLTHTGVLGFDTFYDIPVVSMVAEDQDLLERFLDQGKSLRMKIKVQNRVTDGPVETANVVGDVPGTEHPEQVIVVGGHLDSWDLAEGSTDDGTGATSVLGAAEAIVKSGQKPRRTIRFVLFTGEEQGLLGSLAYTKTHKSEMANHLGDLILDNGQGPVDAFNLGGRKDLIPAVSKFAESVKAFGDLKVNDNVVFGTDSGPFTLEGLAGINMSQNSPDYKYTHHSSVDTLDKVKPEILTQNATLMALAAFWIADRPERLDTQWTPEQTAKMLVEKKEDKILKTFGLWPFGNLGAEGKGEQKDDE